MSKGFALGQTVATRGIMDRMQQDAKFTDFVTRSIERYRNADWGEICDEDSESNDQALKNGDDRIFTGYKDHDGCEIWIITEWDHSATTILFPDEY